MLKKVSSKKDLLINAVANIIAILQEVEKDDSLADFAAEFGICYGDKEKTYSLVLSLIKEPSSTPEDQKENVAALQSMVNKNLNNGN